MQAARGTDVEEARAVAFLNRLQTAARLTRTALAARLIAHGFYAGQEQVMIALAQEDGLTPGALAAGWACARRP
jgi:hypothetical protein